VVTCARGKVVEGARVEGKRVVGKRVVGGAVLGAAELLEVCPVYRMATNPSTTPTASRAATIDELRFGRWGVEPPPAPKPVGRPPGGGRQAASGEAPSTGEVPSTGEAPIGGSEAVEPALSSDDSAARRRCSPMGNGHRRAGAPNHLRDKVRPPSWSGNGAPPNRLRRIPRLEHRAWVDPAALGQERRPSELRVAAIGA
ncbi:MAG: hypothetical protein ACYDD6_07500, partial [Acidimicrobiales bacterium]